MHGKLRRLLAGGVALSMVGLVFAQTANTDAPTSVSIPDSPGAVERLEKARGKEQQKQWKAAADFYQDTLAKYSSRVLPTKIDKEADIFQYAGVGQRVLEQLAKWPTEGLDVYRATYGQQASDLLTAARPDDVAALDHIFRFYFFTEAGKSAGIRLMDVHLEAGRFLAAAWIGRQLLDLHPTLGPDQAMVLFRTAMGYRWGGDLAQAAALLDALRLKHANETGSIGGKDVVLADALAEALKAPIPVPATQPEDADHWPTFGGVEGRGEISSSVAKPGASLQSIPLIPPRLDHLPVVQKLQYEQADQQDIATGQAMGVMPVTDRGALFFQDGRHIYAVNADSGQPLPGWLATNGASANGAYGVEALGRARGEELTVTLTSDRVLAILGQPDRQPLAMSIGAAPSVRLVCLDRTTGKPVWTRAPVDLPETVAPLRLGEYNGTPLIVGDDSVCVIARGGKANQFEDCYVVCLSLKTGEYKWSTYVGSASRIFEGEIGLDPQNTSEMSLAEGRIFVMDNLGTVAALDALDGRMIWLNSYPRDVIDNPALALRNRMNGAGSANKPWANNPVITSDGKIFALPSDGRHLLVYDAGNGEEIKRIALSDYENADVLLGVRGEAAVFTSDKNCFCIDWSTYDHEEPKQSIKWQKDVTADPLPGQDNVVWGRGFMTVDSVFVPTLHRLTQLSWSKSGRLMSTYPTRGKWPGAEEPGNVLVTSQNVIVAGSKQVSVYTDLELLRHQYQQRIAEGPKDPAPRLWFAQVQFASSATDALKTLDEAIALIGGLRSMRPGDDRQQIFATAMGFAQRTFGDNTPEVAAMGEQCFDRAAAAADSPMEQASYLLARAGYDLQKKNEAGAIMLCQQILSNPAIRMVAMSENSTAASQAESTVADAIHSDPASYAVTEQTAAAALVEARKTNDPKRLLDVGLQFPNSKAAAEARQAAAMAFENLADHESAIRTLSEMYASASDPAVKAALLEALARNDLATTDGIGPAIDRLSRGAQLMPTAHLTRPLVSPDGNTIAKVSLTDAVAALRRIEAERIAEALPNFHLPASSSGKEKILDTTDASVTSNVRALVAPLRGFVRNDRVVTWSGTELSIFASGTTTPIGTVKLAAQPLAGAWVNKTLLVWTQGQLLRMDETGKLMWTQELRGLPTLQLASDADAINNDAPDAVTGGAVVVNGQQQIIVNGGGRLILNGPAPMIIRQGGVFRIGAAPAVPPAILPAAERVVSVRPAGERVVITTSTGRLLALDARDGHIAWQLQLANGPIAQVMANRHFTLARLADPAGSQLVVLNTLSGQVIGRRKFGPEDSTNQLVNAALSEDGTLVFTLTNRLLLKDLYEPWKKVPIDLTGKPDADPPSFGGLNQPDQLLVEHGRVLAIYSDGQFVRVQDLSDVNGLRNPLATGAGEPTNVSMRLTGAHLFVLHTKNMAHYNLVDENDHYIPNAYDLDFPPKMRELMVGQDHVLMVDDPVDRGPQGLYFVRLLIYLQTASKTGGGLLQDDPMIENSAGILSWQPADGGVYYLSGDWKLHFLRGAPAR